MGETWGISGPVFLGIYVVIALVALALTIRGRRAVVATPPARPVGDVSTHPHDVAFLNGGPELAVLSALTALRLRGAITSARGTAQAVPGADPGPDGLERGVYAALATPSKRNWLHLHHEVARSLSPVRARLESAGLLLTGDQRRQVKAQAWWLAAAAGLGLVRLLAGLAGGRPVGLLVIAVLMVGALALIMASSVPTRTRAGDTTLAELRTRHHALAPREKPDWRLYGPAGAALGIGMFGAAALWASDPAIAGP
jgi:uncharacterized protein (TIGR04222 family)